MTELDLLADDFRRDPQATYERLHESGVAGRDRRLGVRYVWGRDEAQRVLGDVATFSSALRQPAEQTMYGARTMIFSDPPYHTELRRQFAPFLGQQAIEDAELALSGKVAAMVTQHGWDEPFDAMAAICRPLPVMAICRLIGLGMDEWRELEAASGAIVELSGGPEGARRRRTASRALRARFAALHAEVAGVDVAPTTRAAYERLESSGIGDAEVAAGLMLLLIAGHETTAAFLGNLLVLLSAEVELLQRFERAPQSFVDEALRLVGPIVALRRIARVPAVIAGEEVAPGATVVVLPAAANRDPRVYTDPNRFSLDRDDEPPALAFGFGIHRCAGARLAMMEAKLLLRSLVESDTRFAVCEGGFDYVPSIFVRRPATLGLRRVGIPLEVADDGQ